MPRWFFAVALGALLLRALLWRQYLGSPFSITPAVDERTYWQLAEKIAAGQWRPEEVFYQGPLFSYFLAGLKALVPSFGQTGLAALQLLLNWATGLLVLPLLRRWADERTALAGAALALFFAPATFFALKGLPTTLGLLLLVAGFLALPSGKGMWGGRCVLAGGILALAVLAVPSAMLVLPATAYFLFLRPPAKQRLLPAVTLLTASLVTLLPVTFSNYLQDGSLLLVSANYGVSFSLGNNPSAKGFYSQLPGVSTVVEDEKRDTRRWARKETGLPLNMQGVSRFFLAKGWRFIVENPGRWALLEGRKAILILGGLDVPHEFSLSRERRDFLPWLWAFPFGGTAVLLLSSLALLDAEARKRLLLPFLASAALGGTHLLFYVANRYVCPFYFLLLPAAAAGLVFLPRVIERPWKSVVLLPVALAAFLAWKPLHTTYWEVDDYLAKLVTIYGQNKNLPMVGATLDRLYSVAPNSPLYYSLLGDVYRELGEPELALQVYDHLLQNSPDDRQVRNSRAAVLWELGRKDQAMAELMKVLEKDPEDELARDTLRKYRRLSGESGR